MPEPSVSLIAIYQLRVVLCGVSPLVWRRLLVVSTTSIAELHEILQNAFRLDYLERLDWHRSHLTIDEFNIMVEAMRRFLDSDGNRHAIGDLDELREAVERVKTYQDFQPDKFDRRELNSRLRALTQDREVRR